jgi:hypothetical protein
VFASLQVTPTAGSPVALLGTLVLTALFFGVTAHIAARYVLGDVPPGRALIVGVVPAVSVTALIRFPPWIIILVAVVGDFLVVRAAYRLRHRTTALIVVVHFTVSMLLSLVVGGITLLLGTAPG